MPKFGLSIFSGLRLLDWEQCVKPYQMLAKKSIQAVSIFDKYL